MDTTKILAINVIVVMIPILAIAYSTMQSGILNNSNNNNNNNNSNNKKIRCDNDSGIQVKMFDNEIVPKYIVGKDYKIIPVSPATTYVIVDGCTLVAEGISQ
jgi:hypothetical protein